MLMYKRSLKVIIEFLNSPPPHGKYIIDTQFGKVNFFSNEISPTIAARTDRDEATYLIEIINYEN